MANEQPKTDSFINYTVMIVMHAIANTIIGVSLLLWANISAESVLGRFVPAWFWPSMFIAVGLLAIVGLVNYQVARFSFAFGAIITGIFAVASGWAVVVDDRLAAIPTTAFLGYISWLKLVIALMIRQRENIVSQLIDFTRRGQTVLDSVRDGSAT